MKKSLLILLLLASCATGGRPATAEDNARTARTLAILSNVAGQQADIINQQHYSGPYVLPPPAGRPLYCVQISSGIDCR